MKINENIKNALWILMVIIAVPIFLHQQYNKYFGKKSNVKINAESHSQETIGNKNVNPQVKNSGDPFYSFKELQDFGRLQKKELMRMSFTRAEYEMYEALKPTVESYKNLKIAKEFCTYMGEAELKVGNINCWRDILSNDGSAIMYLVNIGNEKSMQVFRNDKFEINGQIDDIQEIRIVDVRKAVSDELGGFEPLIVKMSGNAILLK